jgi:ferric-dicitrate binding protein FerR (iron transport regulator)
LLFFAWYHQADAGELHRLFALTNDPPRYEEASPAFLETLERKLMQNAPVKRLFPRRWLLATAAAVVLVTAGSLYLLFQNNPAIKPVTVATTNALDIAPGRNGAVLTLSDGSNILLDSVGNSHVIEEKGSRINIENGSLSYDATNASDVVYNTISTPVARQFKLVLPDQSVVWLNAGSSIKYPTVFTGKTRVVEMTGEAYFEVATLRLRSGLKMPFRVKVNNQAEVEVLGTHFNVNAYGDEETIKTTLLEGKVRVVNESGSKKDEVGGKKNEVMLKPGEQAVLSRTNSPLTIDHSPNLSQVVAWKNGIFNFDRLETKEVMRQLARWYDVEVVYEPGVTSRTFYGDIGRNLSLAQVLEGLKLSGVNCSIEKGKKLVVLP